MEMKKTAQEEQKRVTPLHSDRNVQLLLSKFLNGELKTLEPSYDIQTGYHYPVVENILGDSSKVEQFLMNLCETSLLDKKIFDKILLCPKCSSSDISFRYCCPFCKTFNIQKSSLVEHVKCGYMDLEGHFRKNGALFCPKCQEELKRIDVDYRKAGVWCSCNDCSKSFDIPVPEHYCRNCHSISTFEEVIINDIYSFTLKASIKAESSLNWFLSSAISNFLTKEGLIVESSALVKGKSGANHTFDIVAHEGDNSKKIVIDLATSDSSVSEQPVIALFAKIFDVSPERAYLIAIPKVNENAKKMAELYNIRTIEANSPDEAIAMLKEKMNAN
jgi:hypothetical protein